MYRTRKIDEEWSSENGGARAVRFRTASGTANEWCAPTSTLLDETSGICISEKVVPRYRVCRYVIEHAGSDQLSWGDASC